MRTLPRLGSIVLGGRMASLVLAGTYLFSAMLGALRQVLLAGQFGADETTGAFFAAQRVPDMVALFAGPALLSALIPILAGLRRQHGGAGVWHGAAWVLRWVVGTLVLITLLGEVLAPVIARWLLVPGYSAAGQALTADLIRILLLESVVLGVVTVLSAAQMSEHRFVLPALAVALHNLGVLAGIGVARIWPEVGIEGPAWGTVGGAVLQLLIVHPGHRWSGRVWAERQISWLTIGAFGGLLLPNGLGLLVGVLGFLAADAIASAATSEAAIPALHNGWLLAGLPVTLVGTGIGQAVFPRLAMAGANGRRAELRRLLRLALMAGVGLSLGALVVLEVAAPLIVRLLFDRGNYEPEAVALTVTAVRAFAIGLPAFVATEIVTRVFLAMHDARTPFFVNLGQLVVRVAMMVVLTPVFGLMTIPLSLALTAIAEAAVLLLIVRRRLDVARATTT